MLRAQHKIWDMENPFMDQKDFSNVILAGDYFSRHPIVEIRHVARGPARTLVLVGGLYSVSVATAHHATSDTLLQGKKDKKTDCTSLQGPGGLPSDNRRALLTAIYTLS
jgi:hypothetical protein